MNVCEFSNVTKRYGDRVILDRVTGAFARGEMVALIGNLLPLSAHPAVENLHCLMFLPVSSHRIMVRSCCWGRSSSERAVPEHFSSYI